jgi:myo-inositol-1(or 4)-monophosphatase
MSYREGSAALTLCSLACGRIIGYIELHLNSWDCLGAIAVIEGAGGQVSR